ncbi:hypothetical protein [Variovorax sp. PAMC 28711]|uniref:hypothetical protein n=1 Tax=Variovorax sp. PAMC 28711 TaxID=1795631 RepID=UPI00078E0104|nr:hypothetical protein [Variovorax sp. PAMC 28711]AMM26081.1 hypothetical protein AX767_18265 [Variovorax sp. PAMC 28711]
MGGRIALTAGVAALAAGFLFEGHLPARETLRAEVQTDPLQRAVGIPAFYAQAGKVDYSVAPVADYEITGLVVSRHDSDAWWDWIHAASNDHLNVVDLCMVWGANAASGAYEKMSFSSGQFVCYHQSRDMDALAPANVRALSNNHLLTDNPAIARRLRDVVVGDQVRLTGQLVSYSHNAGFAFTRGTSTTRDDTGNGACETLFVRDVEVLRSASPWPRWLRWIGAVLLALGLVRWFAAPHRPRNS